ncbi:tyrosine-protein phosphatase [Bremerella sp. P1]|uniref:tyrosine-protein phosphatase n=1 Tax=Bremerella sp. P1 TaxID=3026424 RepID=UPI0023686516|nr:tyrosine-protein phosphatase [Bremerella sp. P1]WDI43534.1 tyrosine-protein phosphatase [Bremerella sp. P1]
MRIAVCLLVLLLGSTVLGQDPSKLPHGEHLPGVDNVLKVTRNVVSGSQPHGEEGFKTLKELGIDVIVSVDGATPDVENARKYGMRYVHVPIGYDGISDEAQAALKRVMQDFQQDKIFFHCHHGKHRGPAAAAVACYESGGLTENQALDFMRSAGTSSDYGGLWKEITDFKPIAITTELPMLVEVAEVESVAAAMAKIDRIYDQLVLCEKANWKAPPEHADLDPAQQALLMQEGLHETGRLLMEHQYDAKFRKMLAESESLSKKLKQQIEAHQTSEATKTLKAVKASCSACHSDYRN